MAEVDPWPVFTMFLALFLCCLCSWTLRRYNVNAIPESALYIFIGVLIGVINTYGVKGDPIHLFDPNLFLTAFLPIIIFEAGYSMNKREFFANFGLINILAILGTIISTLVVGYGLFWFESLGFFVLSKEPLVPLLFGTIISAIDPVATLVTFSSLHVDRTLYSIVFGESVMNDAVAVALYQTFVTFLGLESFGAPELFEALGLFVAKFVGSFFVGVILSGAVSKILKHLHFEQTHLVIAVFTCTGYVIYNLCEGIKLSGILGVFFSGMTLRHYACYNVEEEARHATEHTLKTGAFLAESIIYIYLGMAFFDFSYLLEWNSGFIASAVLFCLVGRALNVFPLTNLTNLLRVHKIGLNFQVMMWHSGLRGAIAFALCLLIPESVPHRGMLVAGTLFIVVASTILIGASTPTVLSLLRIKTGDKVIPEELFQNARKDSEAAKVHRTIHGRWHRIDRGYLLPFLSNRDVSTMHRDESTYFNWSPKQENEQETAPLKGDNNERMYG